MSSGGSGPLVTLHDGARVLSLSWPAPLPTPVVSGDAAVFADVASGVDLVVRTSTSGFNVYLVVRDRAAASSPLLTDLRLGWSAVGLTLRKTAGGFEAVDGNGVPVFAAPKFAMWSAPGAAGEGSPAEVSAAAVSLQDTGPAAEVAFEVTGSELILHPSLELLADPATEFPVVVDPSVAKYDASWTMVWSDDQKFWNDSTEEARVGYDGWTTGKKSRVFYNMRADLDGKVVSKATFSHRQIHSPRGACDTSSTSDPGVEVWRTGPVNENTTWDSQPEWAVKQSTAYVLNGHRDSCPGYTVTEWDVTKAAKEAAAGGWSTMTLGLRSTDEGNKYGWRRFDNAPSESPKVVVEYNTPPNVPTELAMSNGYSACGKLWAPSRNPTISAKVSDPDGGQVRGRFYVQRDGEVELTSSYVSSGSRVSVGSVTLPDGDHTFTANAHDGGLWSARSGGLKISVDETPPPGPTVTLSSATPKLGSQVTVTLSGTSDVNGYLVGVNTSTPSTWVPGRSVSTKITVSKAGPNTVTVRAKDCAGNESGLVSKAFKVDVLLPSDVYRLDGNGADTRDEKTEASWPAAPLTVPAGATWGLGPFGEPDRFGNVADPTDKAFDTRGPVTSLSTGTQPLAGQSGFSMTAWVKPTTTTPEVFGYGTAVAFADATSSGVMLGTRCTNNQCYWVGSLTGPPGGGGGDQTVFVHDTATRDQLAVVAVDQWTHLGLVWDGVSTARMYVNGDLVATVTGVTIDPRFGDRVQIGAAPWSSTGGAQFTGLVDQVQLYPGPIDANLVAQAFEANRP